MFFFRKKFKYNNINLKHDYCLENNQNFIPIKIKYLYTLMFLILFYTFPFDFYWTNSSSLSLNIGLQNNSCWGNEQKNNADSTKNLIQTGSINNTSPLKSTISNQTDSNPTVSNPVNTVADISLLSSNSASSSASSELKLDKAFISFRIGTNIWNNEQRFVQLLELLNRYPGATDEITFFTQATHAPITDEELEKRCLILKERMKTCRKHGYRSGINILCTIGQHPEDLPHSIGEEIPRAVSLDGKTAQATLCMNQEVFKKRIERIYRAISEAEPDYIWIDDDIRTGHWLDSWGTPGQLCFCDVCLKRINQKAGQNWTREKLAGQMKQSAVLAIVQESVSDSITELFELIESTVHRIKPGLPIGFMTGERYAEGYDFTRWANALAGKEKNPVFWRPGGGFYAQSNISGMLGKAFEVGRQVSLLPPNVANIQSEIENFPYDLLAKSRHITTLEAAAHIAAGCTGAAFNVLTMNEESLDDYEPMIRAIAECRPFYNLLVKHLGRRPLTGVFPVWSRLDGQNPENNGIIWKLQAISQAGIPLTFSKEEANVFLLGREYLFEKTKKEIEPLFTKGVYTDNEALGRLNDPQKLALNDLTGMEYGAQISFDCIEKFAKHPLNGKFQGNTRDGRQSFYRDPVISLKITRPGVETISSAIDYGKKEVAPTILGIFENSLGGRVCVNGYQPWSGFLSFSKQTQLRNIMRWLSKDSLPGYIESFDSVCLFMRTPEKNGDLSMAAINTTYDPAKNLALMLKTDREKIVVYDRFCQRQEIKCTGKDRSYRRFIVPNIAPWDAVLISTHTN